VVCVNRQILARIRDSRQKPARIRIRQSKQKPIADGAKKARTTGKRGFRIAEDTQQLHAYITLAGGTANRMKKSMTRSVAVEKTRRGRSGLPIRALYTRVCHAPIRGFAVATTVDEPRLYPLYKPSPRSFDALFDENGSQRSTSRRSSSRSYGRCILVKTSRAVNSKSGGSLSPTSRSSARVPHSSHPRNHRCLGEPGCREKAVPNDIRGLVSLRRRT